MDQTRPARISRDPDIIVRCQMLVEAVRPQRGCRSPTARYLECRAAYLLKPFMTRGWPLKACTMSVTDVTGLYKRKKATGSGILIETEGSRYRDIDHHQRIADEPSVAKLPHRGGLVVSTGPLSQHGSMGPGLLELCSSASFRLGCASSSSTAPSGGTSPASRPNRSRREHGC